MIRRRPVLSRRGFAALLLHGAALWGGRALARDPETGADRGIGGTGVAPGDPAETLGQDRGIGGTGVIGTIRRFGSIVVNDLRVTFPPDVAVAIDGEPATARDLRLGQVVRVLARRRGDVLATRAIVADSEVVGPVDRVARGGMVVLGQHVVVPAGVAVPPHGPGRHLAVSGLRRLDGTIVASLVEVRPTGPARLRGPVRTRAGGGVAIGGLAVAGLAPSLAGRRVALAGVRRGGVFHPSAVAVEPRMPFAGADSLSVEAYVARAPDGLRLGSGLDLAAGAAALAAVGDAGGVRAVVTARPGPSGRLDAEAVRVERGPHDAGVGETGRHPAGPAAGPPGGPTAGPAKAGPGGADAGQAGRAAGGRSGDGARGGGGRSR